MAKKNKKDHINPLNLYKLLPGTNCKECGCTTCMAFAFKLISREVQPKDCPDLLKDEYKDTYDEFNDMFVSEATVDEHTGLLIEIDKCVGCGDCVVVCQKAITTMVLHGMAVQREEKPTVLQVIDGKVQVVNWESCKRCEKPPEYCTVCELKCPYNALELVK